MASDATSPDAPPNGVALVTRRTPPRKTIFGSIDARRKGADERQTTSSPRFRSSCTSHGVIAPVSIPIRVSSPPCRRTKTLICSGTVGHWPRHSLRPALSTMQMAVIFCETSNPTKRVIDSLRRCESPGETAPIAALSADQAPTAIIGCPHMTTFAPILISFSFRLVSDQCLIGSGVASVRRKLPRL